MNPKNEILSDFEQIETEAVQTARMLVGYYKELLNGHLPQPLIEKLTIDFAYQWWTGSLGLNEQHVFMHNGAEDEE